jgi:hypothetical protein
LSSGFPPSRPSSAEAPASSRQAPAQAEAPPVPHQRATPRDAVAPQTGKIGSAKKRRWASVRGLEAVCLGSKNLAAEVSAKNSGGHLTSFGIGSKQTVCLELSETAQVRSGSSNFTVKFERPEGHRWSSERSNLTVKFGRQSGTSVPFPHTPVPQRRLIRRRRDPPWRIRLLRQRVEVCIVPSADRPASRQATSIAPASSSYPSGRSTLRMIW